MLSVCQKNLARRSAPSLVPLGPGPAFVFTLVLASISFPPLQDNLFRKFIQVFMKDRQNSPTSAEPRDWKDTSDRLFKTQNPDLYYGTLYKEYYYLCWQYKDHFKTARAKSQRRVLFAVFFLENKIIFWWQ